MQRAHLRACVCQCGLLQEVRARRAALASAALEPGLFAWLARQRRAWRRCALGQEQALLLALAGVDLGGYSLGQWRKRAHEAAAYLTGSQLLPAPTDASLAALPHDAGALRGALADLRGAAGQGWPLLEPMWRMSAEAALVGAPAGGSGRSQGGPWWHREDSDHSPHARASGARNGTGLPVLGTPYAVRGGAHAGGGAGPLARGWRAGAPPGRPPGRRAAVARWVETQRALWAEGRLTRLQLRYLSLLGAWRGCGISCEVKSMEKERWSKSSCAVFRALRFAGERRGHAATGLVLSGRNARACVSACLCGHAWHIPPKLPSGHVDRLQFTEP